MSLRFSFSIRHCRSRTISLTMKIQVVLKMNCNYTNALIEEVLEKEKERFQLVESRKILYWMEYEDLDFEMIYKDNRENNADKQILVNSFCIRKALLRKANFAAFIGKYLTKVKKSF